MYYSKTIYKYNQEDNWPGVKNLPYYLEVIQDKPRKIDIKDNIALDMVNRLLTLCPEKRPTIKEVVITIIKSDCLK